MESRQAHLVYAEEGHARARRGSGDTNVFAKPTKPASTKATSAETQVRRGHLGAVAGLAPPGYGAVAESSGLLVPKCADGDGGWSRDGGADGHGDGNGGQSTSETKEARGSPP